MSLQRYDTLKIVRTNLFSQKRKITQDQKQGIETYQKGNWIDGIDSRGEFFGGGLVVIDVQDIKHIIKCRNPHYQQKHHDEKPQYFTNRYHDKTKRKDNGSDNKSNGCKKDAIVQKYLYI